MPALRVITVEEHFVDPRVAAPNAPGMHALAPDFTTAFDAATGLPWAPPAAQLVDLGEGRLAEMDAAGIDMQVLSSLSTQFLPAGEAVELVRGCNDLLAGTVAAHPDRFGGFAALPTTVPQACADELRRGVQELGLVGAMVHGRTDGRFLSDEAYAPLLAAAARLEVPIYIHPMVPPPGTTRENYTGFGAVVDGRLQAAGWGWHAETGIHFLHLVLSGVFDRHPGLQVALGHWGEVVPWFAERLDEGLPPRATGLEHEFSHYLRHNAHLTPSGQWSQAQYAFCRELVGADRFLFSVDHPFVPMEGARGFLAQARVTDEERHAFAHGNAERLLGIAPA